MILRDFLSEILLIHNFFYKQINLNFLVKSFSLFFFFFKIIRAPNLTWID